MKKKIVIVLNHPAHYHLFKYISKILINKGHNIYFIIKDKDILEDLLIKDGVPYIKITGKRKGKNKLSILFHGILELIKKDIKLFCLCNIINPDLLVGTDISITHVGKIKKIPSIVFNEDDYEINKFFCVLSYPFASSIIAPEYCNVGKYTYKKIGYNAIQKMAYLNKKYFKPSNTIFQKYKIDINKPFFLIRIVSLSAGHDIEQKHSGINKYLLKKMIRHLESYGNVYISCENKLDEDLRKYELNINPLDIHNLLYYATLFIGDSQTMCSEAGILGTPFIRYNTFVGKISYLKDLEENYKLGYGIKTDEHYKIFEKVEYILKFNNVKIEWHKRVERLFSEKINALSFFVWFIENYPKSFQIMKKNPSYQYKFK